MTSYERFEVILQTGGANMTSHMVVSNKQNGSLQMMLRQRYKNTENLIIKAQTCLELFSMSSENHN